MELNVTGLITGVKNSGDANRVIETLTPDRGIVYVLASGARRLTSRFLPLTRLFTLVSLDCAQNNGALVLKDGKFLGGFYGIEADADKFRIVAGVVKNIRASVMDCDNISKIYALCTAYFELADGCVSCDEDINGIACATAKFYIYMLYYLGFDVFACAEEYGGEDLQELCRYLSGKKISEAMTDKLVFEGSLMAYESLRSIYGAQLDMTLGNLTE